MPNGVSVGQDVTQQPMVVDDAVALALDAI
jgi:hypothetical protein